MREFFLVTRILRKQSFRNVMAQQFGSRQSSGRKAALLVLIAIGLLSTAAFWCFMCFGMMFGLREAGMGMEIGLLVIFAVAMLMTLFFCIASIMGNLFYAKDTELLVSLPIRGTALFAAKISRVYTSELLVSFLMAAPALVIYGIFEKCGVLFYVNALAIVALLPLLPLAFATVLSLLLTRLTTFTRHRDRLMIFFGVTLTVALVAGSQMFSRSMVSVDVSDIAKVFAEAGGMFDLVSRAFPPARYAALAATLGDGALTGWALYVAISLAALTLALLVASRTFVITALRSRETSKRGIKLDVNKLRGGSPFAAFARREMRNVIRSVTYAMNCLLGAIMFPVMLGIMPLTIASTEMGITGGLAAQLEGLRALAMLAPTRFVYIIAYGVFLFILLTNMVASTTISREGEQVWLLKVVPIPYRTMVYGKLLFAVIVNVITVALAAVVVSVLIPGFAAPVACAAVAASVASVVPSAIGMMVDLNRPKLKWQNEAEVVKQNFNSVIGMVISLGVTILFAAPTAIAGVMWGMWQAVTVSAVVSVGVAWLSVWQLGRSAERNLDRLGG